MLKDIKKIIHSMDVKQDREDAESKALSIYKLGSEALDILVDLGRATMDMEIPALEKKKILRAIIFSISIFAVKDKSSSDAAALIHSNLLDLLYHLSMEGYQSAAKVLHSMDISEADVQKNILLALPIVEKHIHDREVSLYEAIEEIKLSRFLSGRKKPVKEVYYLGRDKKYDYELLRIGKKLFAVRQHKLSI